MDKIPTETRGTYYNTECPHCGKINHYVSTGHMVLPGKITKFTRNCHCCKKLIYYHAKLAIEITAYSYDPFDKSESSLQQTKATDD